MSEWTSWMRLASVRVLEVPTLLKLLEAFGGAREIEEATYAALAKVAGGEVARAIRAAEVDADVEATEAWLARCPDARVLTIVDDDYPAELLRAQVAPLCLYIRGNPRLLSEPPVGIFGSRTGDEEALYNAKSFAYTLACKKRPVAVWLRPGVSLAAVEGAGGALTAFLEGPIDKVPDGVERATLARILSAGGLLVSLTPPRHEGEDAAVPFVPFVAAWIRAALVVGAKRHSKAVGLAQCAVELGRDVFAVPGSIHSPYNKGAHFLLRRGAKLTECVEDLFDELDTNTSVVQEDRQELR